MGRKFIRLSLGGVHDEAEIRGHRRTYIGCSAWPYPADHGESKGGQSALSCWMRVDNSTLISRVTLLRLFWKFLILSKTSVFPITIWRSLTTFPKFSSSPLPTRSQAFRLALLDRMEVIEFPGYIEERKADHRPPVPDPEQLLENGMDEEEITISDDALRLIINSYTYEAGVRNLNAKSAACCASWQSRKQKENPLNTP